MDIWEDPQLTSHRHTETTAIYGAISFFFWEGGGTNKLKTDGAIPLQQANEMVEVGRKAKIQYHHNPPPPPAQQPMVWKELKTWSFSLKSEGFVSHTRQSNV